MKIKKLEIATFFANDVDIANTFAEMLTEESEHLFKSWELSDDCFELMWYVETKADLDDMPKAVEMLKCLGCEELKMRGIFEFKVNDNIQL